MSRPCAGSRSRAMNAASTAPRVCWRHVSKRRRWVRRCTSIAMAMMAPATATASRIHPHGVESSSVVAVARDAATDGSGAGVDVTGAAVVTVAPVGAAATGGGACDDAFERLGMTAGLLVLTCGGSLVGGRVKPLRVDVAGGESVSERSGDDVRSGRADEPLPEHAALNGTTANDRTSTTRSARLVAVIRPSSEAVTEKASLPHDSSHHPQRVIQLAGVGVPSGATAHLEQR